MDTIQAQNYISKRRSEGATDGTIFDELVSNGWDKNTVSGLVFGNTSNLPPKPSPTVANSAPVFPQDLQVVSTKGGSEQTRMGILTAFLSSSLMVVAYSLSRIANIVLEKIFGWGPKPSIFGGASSIDNTGEVIVWYVSICIPVSIVAVFCYRILNKKLIENPVLADDIYYRKNIRSALKFSLAIVIISLIIVIYQTLITFTNNSAGIFDKYSVLGWSTKLVLFSLTSVIFWNFSKKSSK